MSLFVGIAIPTYERYPHLEIKDFGPPTRGGHSKMDSENKIMLIGLCHSELDSESFHFKNFANIIS